MSLKTVAAVAISAITVLAASANAQNQPPHGTNAPSAAPDWPSSPMRFQKGLKEQGGFAAYSWETAERRADSQYYSGALTWGKFIRPKLELTLETPISYYSKPSGDFSIGAVLGARYYLRNSRRFAPFVEVGNGPSLMHESNPNLTGALQFLSHAGAGVRIGGKRGAFNALIRFQHVSNGGYSNPNVGINAAQIVLGYSRYK